MGRTQRKVEEQFKKFEGGFSRVKIRSQVANIANDKVEEGRGGCEARRGSCLEMEGVV